MTAVTVVNVVVEIVNSARELGLEEVYESAAEAELMDCSAILCGALQPAAASAEAAPEYRRTYWEVCRENK